MLRKPRRVFRLPTSDFRLPTSNFQLPTSCFQLPTSNFRLLISDFQLQQQWKVVIGLHDFYLMLKCCLFQKRFFPLLHGRLCSRRFWLSRIFHIERSWHRYRSIYCGFCFWSAGFALWCKRIFCKAFYYGRLRALFFSKVPCGPE